MCRGSCGWANRCMLLPPQVEMLHTALGDKYQIQSILLDPVHLGWPVRRLRRYTVLTHKKKVAKLRMPLSDFAALFTRQCNVSYREFQQAKDNELEFTLKWATSRASVRIRQDIA